MAEARTQSCIHFEHVTGHVRSLIRGFTTAFGISLGLVSGSCQYWPRQMSGFLEIVKALTLTMLIADRVVDVTARVQGKERSLTLTSCIYFGTSSEIYLHVVYILHPP